MKALKKKIITVLIAIVLIIVIGVVAFGGKIKSSIENGEEINARFFLALIYPEKYAYSEEMADFNEYYQLFSESDIAIVLQNEKLEDKAQLIDGIPYFSYDTVNKLFTNRFYYNAEEQQLLYSTAKEIIRVEVGENSTGYYTNGEFAPCEEKLAVCKEDTLYIAADYVKKYANFEYTFYTEPNRMQIYNSWEPERQASLLKETKVRYQGGIKSPILCEVNENDTVTILEVMENWTRIKTEDGFIGYVEKDKLSEEFEGTRTPVTDAYNPYEDYSVQGNGEQIVLAWHQIFYADDGTDLNNLTSTAKCINVVAPTWYYITDSDGTFANLSNSNYVVNAHNKGFKVWALVEDMTNEFDEYELFANSDNRKNFIDNLVKATTAVGADGINVDCEKITKESGPHFVQFLRELSIEAHKNGLVLSVDNYQMNQGNLYYNLKEQGLICDYVILMSYDEHWTGSDPGSVASLGFVESGISNALEAGVPADKLINGVPFYTRLYKVEGVETSSTAIGMTEAWEWANNRSITPGWSDEDSQYVVDYQDGTAEFLMWIEDKESLEAKLSVMDNLGVAGVACWKLGLESPDAWDVIEAHYGEAAAVAE